jgi:hypothetical protein
MDLGGVGQGEKLSILPRPQRLQRYRSDRKRLGNFSGKESRPICLMQSVFITHNLASHPKRKSKKLLDFTH